MHPQNTEWIEDELNRAVREYKNMLDARDAVHTDEPDKKMVPMLSVQTTFGTKIRKQPRDEPEPITRRMHLMCPTLTLACDSISSSLSKCGFYNWQDGKFYLHLEGFGESVIDDDQPERIYDYTSGSGDYDPLTCEPDFTCAHHTDIYDSDLNLIFSDDDTDCAIWYDHYVSGTGDLSHDSGIDVGAPFGTYFPDGAQSWLLDFSIEYTDAMVCENAITALPAYSETLGCHSDYLTGQGCECSAFKDVSEDGTSCTIRRFKYQLLFDGPADFDLEITWCERFIPEGGDEGDATYTMKSSSYTHGDPGNTDIYEVMEPDDDGTIDICCIRCCLIDPDTGEPPEGVTCAEATCP